jgi:hypothetical protein
MVWSSKTRGGTPTMPMDFGTKGVIEWLRLGMPPAAAPHSGRAEQGLHCRAVSAIKAGQGAFQSQA